jgi:hypothetical protein
VTEVGGIKYIGLATLIDLKLASGMTSSGRLRDLGDVQELIKYSTLPEEFSLKLNPYVRAKFIELHKGVADETRRQAQMEG